MPLKLCSIIHKLRIVQIGNMESVEQSLFIQKSVKIWRNLQTKRLVEINDKTYLFRSSRKIQLILQT